MKIISLPTPTDNSDCQIADSPAAEYQLGPTVVIKFSTDLPSGHGCWDPDSQVILVDSADRGIEFAQTMLHEVGHMLCGDHAQNLSDEEHDWLEEWAGQAARLLALLRPGRRAVAATS